MPLSTENIFTARCYASAVLAMGLCLSVCHKSVFYRNGWTNRAACFWHVNFLPPVLHCVKRKFGIFRNKGTSLWNFVLKSGLKFRHDISIVETCINLAREVVAQSMINWVVVRRSTKSIIPPSSDARPLVYCRDRQALSTARFCRTGQLAATDTLFRTCRTSSFCTVAWQLARFQLTAHRTVPRR